VIKSSSIEISSNDVLPWQLLQWRRMVTLVNANKLPHAFLFSGVAGIGKELFAKHLSSFLLCDAVKCAADSDDKSIISACRQCKQCKLFESESHPDFKLIEPEEGSTTIKIDQIRQLVNFFSHSSQQGGRKIAILTPAEALNNNAANALLKTLEEPSFNSVIILVSHQSGMLLPTIRSRCQVLDFSQPSVENSLEWLNTHNDQSSDKAPLTDEDIAETLFLANYSPLKALSYLEIDALAEYRRMLQELGAILKNDCLSTALASRWNDDISILRLSWIMLWLEQILKLKFGTKLNESYQAEKMFTYLSNKASSSELFALHSNCLKQYKLFLGTSNPNKVLAFEALLHDWSSLMRKP
jgi:DNA polymerase-3 subunit delta'